MPVLKSESYLKSKTQNHVPDLKSERENLAVPYSIFLTIYVRKCLRSAEELILFCVMKLFHGPVCWRAKELVEYRGNLWFR